MNLRVNLMHLLDVEHFSHKFDVQEADISVS